MAADSPSESHARRLNPFVFPSDTTFRFVLLIIFVVGASLFSYNSLFYRFSAVEFGLLREQCVDEVYEFPATPTDPADANDRDLDIKGTGELMTNLEKCMAPWDQAQITWSIGGVLLLLIVAGVLYWTAPALKIWRERLVPFRDEDAPEVVAYLDDLCQEAGLCHPPTFVWSPMKLGSSGLAFGRLGRYYVALTGGLVTQFYADRPAFRAVVLHELAHLRNADINKTYFAVAVWRAFVVAALVPLAITLVHGELIGSDNSPTGPAYVFDVTWRVLALAALVYLTRSAILRAREVYADVRASEWDGPSGTLERVLATLPHPKGSRWLAMLQVHPDPDRRRRVLTETSRLFRMGFWDAFGTGIAATIAVPNIISLLDAFPTVGVESMSPSEIATALLFAPLVVGVVGLGAWRGVFAALTRGEALYGVGLLGLGLGLGIMLGPTLSFNSPISLPQPTDAIDGVDLFVFYVLWGALLLTSMFFFLRWVVAGASVWLEIVTTRRSLRLIYVLGLMIAGGLLTWLLGFFFLVLHQKAASFLKDSVYTQFRTFYSIHLPHRLPSSRSSVCGHFRSPPGFGASERLRVRDRVGHFSTHHPSHCPCYDSRHCALWWR